MAPSVRFRRLQERATANAAISQELVTTSRQVRGRAVRAHEQAVARHVVAYLVRSILGVQPVQEARLDAIAGDLDRWLALNGATQYGPALRRLLARWRAQLARHGQVSPAEGRPAGGYDRAT